MKFPRIITRRRAKWAGLAITTCLAAAMIASYWYWPSLTLTMPDASVRWQVNVAPGGMLFSRNEGVGIAEAGRKYGLSFRSRPAQTTQASNRGYRSKSRSPTTAWLVKYETSENASVHWQRWAVPFWIPMALGAMITAGLCKDGCVKCLDILISSCLAVCVCMTCQIKWTGVFLSSSLAAGMIASFWYWPGYLKMPANSSLIWRAKVGPDELRFDWFAMTNPRGDRPVSKWTFDRRGASGYSPKPVNSEIVWLPSFNFGGKTVTIQHHVSIPLWMPLVLCAVPTGIAFYRDRKPKPGCCLKCKYDLAGLSGDTCPECGTKIAKTESNQAPASTASGENGVT